MSRTLDRHLAALRTLVEEARAMPMSASVMINRSEILRMIDELEKAVGLEVAQAHDLVDDREAVVASGRSKAEEILRAAQAEREQLVSDTDVYRLGSARAEEIKAEAARDAAELRAEADEYVEGRLANFELTLERTLDVVRRGRARLTGGHSGALGDDSDVDDITLPEHLRR